MIISNLNPFLSPITLKPPLHPPSLPLPTPLPNHPLILLPSSPLLDLQPPSRCRISPTRRGQIAYVGAVPELPGPQNGPWIGIILDEPVGKNDGSVGAKRYFECERARGVFVRPDRVEKGDWGVLGVGGEEGDDDLEEI